MKLTRDERSRLLGDCKELPAVIREEEPNVKQGDTIIVLRARPPRHADPDDGHVFDAPLEPVVWLTVRQVVRHRKGGWKVRYDVTDLREAPLYPARKAGYTTDSSRAIEKAEAALSKADHERISLEARQARAEEKEEQMDVAQQKRRLRSDLNETLPTLRPEARIALLAGIERLIREAKTDAVETRVDPSIRKAA